MFEFLLLVSMIFLMKIQWNLLSPFSFWVVGYYLKNLKFELLTKWLFFCNSCHCCKALFCGSFIYALASECACVAD